MVETKAKSAATPQAAQSQPETRAVARVSTGLPTSDGAGVKLLRLIGTPALPDPPVLVRAKGGFELLAGGGVRDAADVAELAAAGVDGVLAGTALHEGRDLAQGG